MAALTYLTTGYVVMRGGQGATKLSTNLYPNIDGSGTVITSSTAKMAIIEIVESPISKHPRLFISPESATGGTPLGGGVRSIGLGEIFKVSKSGDTNTELTFATGQTLALASTFETQKCGLSANQPITVKVDLYA